MLTAFYRDHPQHYSLPEFRTFLCIFHRKKFPKEIVKLISQYIWDMDTQVELLVTRNFDFKNCLEVVRCMGNEYEKPIRVIIHDMNIYGLIFLRIFICAVLKYTNTHVYMNNASFLMLDIRIFLESLGVSATYTSDTCYIHKYNISMYRNMVIDPRHENIMLVTSITNVDHACRLARRSIVKRIIIPFYLTYNEEWTHMILDRKIDMIHRLDIRSTAKMSKSK